MECLIKGGQGRVVEKDAQRGEIGDIGEDIEGGPEVADGGILEVIDGGDKGGKDDEQHGEVDGGFEAVAEVEAFEEGDKHGAQGLPHGEDGDVDVAEGLGVGEDEEDEEEDGERH